MSLVVGLAVAGCSFSNAATAKPQGHLQHFSLHQNIIEELSDGDSKNACNYRVLLPQLPVIWRFQASF